MEIVKQFNGLNGAKVTRAEIQALIALARKEEQDQVVKRLESVLKNYPDEKFLLEIDNPALEQVPASILNGLDFEENEIITPGLNKAVSPDEIYQMITDQIIEAMEKPLDNWEKEWGADKNGFLIAYNFESKKQYRSINQIALNPHLFSSRYPILKNPYFLTFKQIEENKGKLKKGSKGLRVTYYTTLYRVQSQEHDIDFATYDVKKFIDYVISNHVITRLGLGLTVEEFVSQSQLPILKYYNVFNGADVEGIDFDLDNFKLPGKVSAITNHHEKLPVCEAVIAAYPKPKVKFTYGGDSAHFMPTTDTINMPNLEQFKYVQAYYTTFFHEMIHSTGVDKRLKRDMSGRMKGTPAQVKKYAFEELIAEIGAMFLCSQAGILHFTVRNSLAYIKGWRSVLLKILKEDNKFVFRAATQSQKAADYLLENVDFDKIIIEEKPKREPKKASDKGKKRPFRSKKNASEIEKLIIQFNRNCDKELSYDFKKTSKKFKPGDKWSDNFDFKGMYEAGTKASEKDGLSYLEKLFDSFEDVNSHEAAKPLWEAIVLLRKQDEKPKREPKKASDYGKKRKHEKKAKYPFNATEIPYETAYRAHTGTSFSPEKRAKGEQEGYFQSLKDVYDKYQPKAVAKNRLSEFENAFDYLHRGYLKRYLDYLRSRHGFYSTMIAGGSNFPVARMNKKSSLIDSKMDEMIKFFDYAVDKIKDSLLTDAERPVKTGAANALEILKQKLAKKEEEHKINLMGNNLIKKIRPLKISEQEKYEMMQDELRKLGYDKLAEGFKYDSRYNFGVFGFHSSNSSAEIRRLKQRIAIEEKLSSKKDDQTTQKEFSFEGGSVELDYSENRVKIYFDSIPDADLRNKLKGAGYAFKWSPKNKAWQRQLNTFRIDLLKNVLPGFQAPAKPAVNSKSIAAIEKPKKTADELDKINPKSFSIKPKSTAVNNAIKDVLSLPKFKGEKEMVASIIFQHYKGIEGLEPLEATEFSDFENEIVYNSKNQTELYSTFEDGITEYGIEFIQAVKNRLQSLKNQKHNYAMFDGLKAPVIENPVIVSQPISNNPKIQKIGTAQASSSQYFTVAGEVGKFLQAVERKPVHSVVITMDGQQGAGKTTTLYKFMDAFASPGNKCLFISGEEHPSSSLAIDKGEKYLSPAAKQNIDTVGEVESTQELYDLIAPYDVIFIDSWQKLLRMVGTIRLDEDLRKRFNGKVFVIIFQQTTEGRTKGGAEVVFDGDIIIKMVKEARFADNYAYFDKNRYTKVPIETLRYNIATGAVYNPNPEELEPEQTGQLNGVQLGTFTFTEV